MRISSVANVQRYEIRLYEFVAPNGRIITSFFQVIFEPDISMGCFEFYDEAICFIDRQVLEKCSEKPASFFTGLTDKYSSAI